MEEKRKYKRLPIKLRLAINELFRQDHEILENLHISADVINISRDGIGFRTASKIPLDYYFDCKIEFSDEDYFYGVVKVIREEVHEDSNIYGCQFIGLAGFLADKVDEYERKM